MTIKLSSLLEVLIRFELMIEILQTSALPLGYSTEKADERIRTDTNWLQVNCSTIKLHQHINLFGDNSFLCLVLFISQHFFISLSLYLLYHISLNLSTPFQIFFSFNFSLSSSSLPFGNYIITHPIGNVNTFLKSFSFNS